MKKPNPPAELGSYQYDEKASKTPLLARVLGWLSVLAFLAAVYVSVFLKDLQMMKNSYIGFGVLFIGYVIVKIIKRNTRCSQCGQTMNIVDVKWTPQQWKEIQGYELIDGFEGADGNLYTIEKEKTRTSTHYFIHGHIQQWCACHACHLYFLKKQYWQQMLFSSIYEDEFEQAKHAVLTDPHASEKMLAAYQARLQGN